MVQGPNDTIVCVVGLGYVGYPLADAFSRHVKTIGYDIDEDKIARINAAPGNRSSPPPIQPGSARPRS